MVPSPSGTLSRPVGLLARSVGARGLQFLLSFALSVVVARTWGAEGLGAYGTGAAFGAFGVLAGDLGLNTAALRWFVLAGPSKALHVRLLSIKSRLLLPALPVVGVIIVGITHLEGVLLWTALLVAASSMVATLNGPSVAVLRAALSMDEELAATSLERITTVGLVALLSVAGAAVWSIGLLSLATSVLLVVALALLARRHVRDVPAPGVKVAAGLPYAGALLFETVAFRFDAVLLPRYVPVSEVGAYVAAYRLVFVVAGVAAAVQAVLLPRWIPIDGHTRGARKQTLNATILAAFAIAAGVALFPNIVELLLGREFSTSVALLRTLSLSIFFVPVYFIVSTALVADGLTRWFLAGWATAGTLNLVANLAILPRYGARGAAITTVLSDGTLLAVWLFGAVRGSHIDRATALSIIVAACVLVALIVAQTS